MVAGGGGGGSGGGDGGGDDGGGGGGAGGGGGGGGNGGGLCQRLRLPVICDRVKTKPVHLVWRCCVLDEHSCTGAWSVQLQACMCGE